MNVDNRAESLSPQWSLSLPDKRTIQTGLLVLTVALAAISLVPSLSGGTALALRAAALLLSGSKLLSSQSEDDKVALLSRIGKVVVIATGLIAVVAGIPQLLIASLAISAGISAIDLLKSLKEGKKTDSLIDLGFLTINALALAALLSGSWQVMVAASAISSVLMGSIAYITLKNGTDKHDLVNGACYVALALLGVAGAVRSSKVTTRRPMKSNYSITNDTTFTAIIYDKTGHRLASLKPNESIKLQDPWKDGELRVKLEGEETITGTLNVGDNRTTIKNSFSERERVQFAEVRAREFAKWEPPAHLMNDSNRSIVFAL